MVLRFWSRLSSAGCRTAVVPLARSPPPRSTSRATLGSGRWRLGRTASSWNWSCRKAGTSWLSSIWRRGRVLAQSSCVRRPDLYRSPGDSASPADPEAAIWLLSRQFFAIARPIVRSGNSDLESHAEYSELVADTHRRSSGPLSRASMYRLQTSVPTADSRNHIELNGHGVQRPGRAVGRLRSPRASALAAVASWRFPLTGCRLF